MSEYEFPGPLGSAKDDPYTYKMPKRELQSRIASHKALYGRARRKSDTMLEKSLDQTNIFNKLNLLKSTKSENLVNCLNLPDVLSPFCI